MNPNFRNQFLPNHRAYTVNCGSCAFAVERRLNGDTTAVANATNIGTDAEMEKMTGRTCTYLPVEEIREKLIQQGPGAHTVAGINRMYPDGTPVSGHWFNIFYDGEEVRILDGQCGEVFPFPYDYGNVSEWCMLI